MEVDLDLEAQKVHSVLRGLASEIFDLNPSGYLYSDTEYVIRHNTTNEMFPYVLLIEMTTGEIISVLIGDKNRKYTQEVIIQLCRLGSHVIEQIVVHDIRTNKKAFVLV